MIHSPQLMASVQLYVLQLQVNFPNTVVGSADSDRKLFFWIHVDQDVFMEAK